ncbi:hypothetical protein MAUB1S_00126 [Mycolicibacterium aubagnense]
MRLLTWPTAVMIMSAALGVFAPGTACADSGPSGTTGAHGSEHAAISTQVQPSRYAPTSVNDKHERHARNSSVPSATKSESKPADPTNRDERSTAPVAVDAASTPAEVSQSGRKTVPRAATFPARTVPPRPVEETPRTTTPAELHSPEPPTKDAPAAMSAKIARTVVPVAQPESKLAAVSVISSPTTTAKADAITPAPAPTLLGVVTGLIFGVLTDLERLLTGPPTVPAGSTVTVRSSTLQVATGVVVPADWYYPAGKPPERMILLQHGFFAIGAMYSETAATLATATDSVVVVPTLTSNPLADGGLWVNGVGMQQAVARLFVGDRAALTASALAADYAQQYGLSAGEAVLPTQFALAGHSAGGALVSGAAGYLVDYGAANDLAGVLLLDAVTTGDQLSGALVKLDAYQQQTGHYIPVQEIGSPPNLWNFISNVNATLSQVRPDHFAGVVLSGGVHTDSMGGGSPISEFLVHLVAGVPIKQNSLALRQLSGQWLNDWFSGNTVADDNLAPGTTLTIATATGTAVGTVIGTPASEPVSVAPNGIVLTAV